MLGQTDSQGQYTQVHVEFMDDSSCSIIQNSKAHPGSDMLTLLKSGEAQKLC